MDSPGRPPGAARLPWILGQAGSVALGVVRLLPDPRADRQRHEVAEEHARDLFHVEKAPGIDFEAPLQRRSHGSEALETFANWVYIWGHWPVIIVTMVWLVWRHRPGSSGCATR